MNRLPLMALLGAIRQSLAINPTKNHEFRTPAVKQKDQIYSQRVFLSSSENKVLISSITIRKLSILGSVDCRVHDIW